MDTKLKKRKPMFVFICLLLSVSVLIVVIGSGLTLMQYQPGCMQRFTVYDTYQLEIGRILNNIYVAIDRSEDLSSVLEAEQYNMDYFIIDDANGVWSNLPDVSTKDAFLAQTRDSQEESMRYQHILMIDGNWLEESVYTVFESTRDAPWMNLLPQTSIYPLPQGILTNSPYMTRFRFAGESLLHGEVDMDSIQIILAIKQPADFVQGGNLYHAYLLWQNVRLQLTMLIASAFVAVLILLITLTRFRSLGIAHRAIAKEMSRMWVEVKLALFIASGVLFYFCLENSNWMMAIPAFWICWMVLSDFAINRKHFFATNMIQTARRMWHLFCDDKPFLQRMKLMLALVFGWEFMISFVILVLSYRRLEFSHGVALTILGQVPAVLFLYYCVADLKHFSALMDYAAAIRNGKADQHPLPPVSGVFVPLAEDLVGIHNGISQAVEQQLHSERMKVELITNVSHDLKTPLTSIINYVDLLGKEQLDPAFANDYVKILAQKSERLKVLVADLFEVSKANSGAVEMQYEPLDLCALLEQTIAELDEKAGQAGVALKTRLPEDALIVYGDGKKLHRVFENLLGNAYKYALSGTRVYLEAQRQGEQAVVSFKNVSNYEMDFAPDEMLERFQRGDSARSTEGSGLGLAIAKSFTELCGGSLQIGVDGDLFKATVLLPIHESPAEPTETAWKWDIPLDAPDVAEEGIPIAPTTQPAEE